MNVKLVSVILVSALLSSCLVGPNYKRPPVHLPKKFKEAPKGWKVAEPKDYVDRGEWWKIFNDPELNELEAKLNHCNQSIKVAAAQYWQARALVDEARAAFFPTISSLLSIFRQKSASVLSSSSGITSAGSGSGAAAGATGPITNYLFTLNATWEPDLWGAVRRAVEASEAGAQASAAQLALVRLSSQASLAQYYFELRGVDTDQKILNDTVKSYEEDLKITRNRYAAGVAAMTDVIQAKTQLESTQAQAINVGISRATYEHAIAVLIGVPASEFSLPPHPLTRSAPNIPLEVPCELLERRPDVAQAERLMAQANAQIGVAVAAFFPTVTLSSLLSMQGVGNFSTMLSNPKGWAAGGQAAQTFFDGGYRNAAVSSAKANYEATVASYRQTVLAAVQNVEDNLASLRLLKQQTAVLKQAEADAKLALKLVLNQYKAGTADFTAVIVAQVTAFTAEKNAADVNYLQMTSAVGLIMALGGGWDVCSIKKAADCPIPKNM